MSKNEIAIIVDENNTQIGSEPRSKMRKLGLIHRATYILVFNSKKEIFVQKRTKTKDVYPGYYDVVSGGVVTAGETYDESAKRELEEEVGIKDVPLFELFEFFFKESKMKVWGKAYSCSYEGDIILQEEEVESGSFMNLDEVILKSKYEKYCPDGIYVLKRYLEDKRK
ncbi:NUDIX hydrolase YfcD [candidate division KSB1 bacterium]|nr:NUDIX hydrolase YfcD [candidate division KSB1 bacterium]MBL7093909.1 NUDIX hydrolase YfcD [candidate division KSB1 bacterium]